MLTGKTDPGAGPYGLVLTGPRTYAASGGVVMCVNVNLVRFLSVRLSLGCATWNVNSWVMLPSHCGGVEPVNVNNSWVTLPIVTGG